MGAACLYGVYYKGIDSVLDDNGTKEVGQGIFSSYPAPFVQENIGTLMFDQAVGTALLLIIILAATDGKNMKVASGLVPLYIGLGLSAIHFSFAGNAGCAINPARDFSP